MERNLSQAKRETTAMRAAKAVFESKPEPDLLRCETRDIGEGLSVFNCLRSGEPEVCLTFAAQNRFGAKYLQNIFAIDRLSGRERPDNLGSPNFYKENFHEPSLPS